MSGRRRAFRFIVSYRLYHQSLPVRLGQAHACRLPRRASQTSSVFAARECTEFTSSPGTVPDSEQHTRASRLALPCDDGRAPPHAPLPCCAPRTKLHRALLDLLAVCHAVLCVPHAGNT
jgi:hypothetical protein